MNFNEHWNLKGKHASLSPSSYTWIKHDEDQLKRKLISSYATDVGTIIHDYAQSRIQYKCKLNRYEKNSVMIELLRKKIPLRAIPEISDLYSNLMAYVNDAIALDLSPEVVLYFSPVCFGTTDAIGFNGKLLEIHDLKTGKTPAHMEQLEIYAALFCLEYFVNPIDISFELRIYQQNEVSCFSPSGEEIQEIMDSIVEKSDIAMKFLGLYKPESDGLGTVSEIKKIDIYNSEENHE